MTDTRVARIVVTGSECTGKTTLARQLSAHLRAPWVAEYSREYAGQVRRPLTAADVEPIGRGQLTLNDRAVATARTAGEGGLVILDTDLVSTLVYAGHYYGDCPPWIRDAARRRLGDLYLLADLDLPWEADSVRDQPQARREIHERFTRTLADLGIAPHRVWGLGEARLQNALASVRGWRATRPSRRNG